MCGIVAPSYLALMPSATMIHARDRALIPSRHSVSPFVIATGGMFAVTPYIAPCVVDDQLAGTRHDGTARESEIA